MISIDTYVMLLAGAFTISLCLLGPRLAPAIGLVDIPGGRKAHAHPTPLLGGLAVVFIFFPAVLAICAISFGAMQPMLLSMAACTAAIAALGIVDDRHLVDPNKRLIISAAIFAIVTVSFRDLTIGIINWNGNSGGIFLGSLAPLITTVALVAFINSVNLADGKNGLVLGISLGWLVMLGLSAPESINVYIYLLSLIVSILLVFNLNGRLFLGDGGSYGIASAVGLLAVYVYQNSDVMRSADQVGLMFMVPVGDMIRLMVARTRAGKSAFAPDRDHLHHLLLERFGWIRGLLSYWFMVLVPAGISLAFPSITMILVAASFTLYWVVIAIAHRRTPA